MSLCDNPACYLSTAIAFDMVKLANALIFMWHSMNFSLQKVLPSWLMRLYLVCQYMHEGLFMIVAHHLSKLVLRSR